MLAIKDYLLLTDSKHFTQGNDCTIITLNASLKELARDQSTCTGIHVLYQIQCSDKYCILVYAYSEYMPVYVFLQK